MDGAPMPSWIALWNEWEIQVVVVVSFSLQVILFFFAGIRRYSVSFVLKVLLWLVYLLADIVAMYALGHMSSFLSKKSSSEHQLVALWAPFLLLHLGGQDTITAYALEDNELWLRHLLNMFLQVAGTAYVLYKYIIAGGATFIPAAMLVLAAGFIKYGERIWALKCASKGSQGPSDSVLFAGKKKESSVLFAIKEKISSVLFAIKKTISRVLKNIFFCFTTMRQRNKLVKIIVPSYYAGMGCFTKDKQFGIYAFIVMTAHALRYALVKPLIIDRNEAFIDWSGTTIGLLNGHAEEYPREDEGVLAAQKRHTEELYKAIEVELGLMYDMLYTKAEVVHTWYGYCIRAISLVSCFTALVFLTKGKRDGYSTPDIVITFALLGGACALEVASVFKAIGSTWTYGTLKGYGWRWLANAILFARYHLVVVKDGRWSNLVGQYNFISFCARDETELREAIAKWIGLQDLWNKAHYTKHAKLSPAVKEFVWDLLRGEKCHMVQIEDVAIRNGYWARRLKGFNQSQLLDWSLSFEFQKSVLIWHIATSTFLNDRTIKSKLVDKDDKDMAEAVNTLSDYMMYLLVKHPDILPMKAAARNLFHRACNSYAEDFSGGNVDSPHQIIMDYKERRIGDIRKLYGDLTQDKWDAYPGEAVLVKACSLARTLVDMELGVTHKMVIIGTVWTEMLCYAAINASGGFHARQLSNGGEFLTHILLLTKYSAAMPKIANPYIREADRTVEGSADGHVELDVDDCSNQIIQIR